MLPETRHCLNCKTEFLIAQEDFAFYEKMKVPPPTWCPDCRFQRRLSWRNERGFFHNTCKKCSKKILSVYSPNSDIVVYCRPCWWSDDWDAMDYGVDFDPSRPFFEQMQDLLHRVPLPDLFGLYTTLENSEYTNMVGYLKNCYFLSMADYDEDCSYGSSVYHCKDSLDSLMLYESELCYEDVNCYTCYKTLFSIDCDHCTNVIFSKNCSNCSDCIGCVNLKNKRFCIFNVQYSEREYRNRAGQYMPTSRIAITAGKRAAEAFWKDFPTKYIHEQHTEQVSGDYIYNSKNTRNSFIVQEMEQSRYCAHALPGKAVDVYDNTHFGIDAQLLYENLQCAFQVSRVRFSWFAIIDVMNVEYGIFNIGTKDCFGSVGIKKKQYCILNKQYGKEEYESLRGKIISQMNDMPYKDSRGVVYRYGEFFPCDMSPFAYNVSSAQEFFPLEENSVVSKGFTWDKPEKGSYLITLPCEDIPDSASEIPAEILNHVIECEHKGSCLERCSGAFKILARDLKFYHGMNLPLPSLCPNCRHYQRVIKRNPHTLSHRQCMCENSNHNHAGRCANEFDTTYSVDRPEIVYCEECYQAEVM